MEKTWPEKYRTYDVSIKLNAIARYEAGGISLRNLADEIGVNRSTLWSWVRKSRSPGMLPTEPSKTVFVDVTPEFRLGMYGLRKLIGEPKPHCLYVFASNSMSAIKIIETEEHACWLYQKKLFKGRFQYPSEGEESELTKEEIAYIIEGVSLVARIESGGKKTHYRYY